MTRILCGVDVASNSLEARIGQYGAASSFPNNTAGIAALAAFCRTHPAELVAMEATGGYEQQAFALLSRHGLPVAILNSRAVRQFAQAMGSLEKTYAIDATLIAWYAEVKNSPPGSLAPIANDSGKHQGKRSIRGGRASVREILFIVASVVGR